MPGWIALLMMGPGEPAFFQVVLERTRERDNGWGAGNLGLQGCLLPSGTRAFLVGYSRIPVATSP